MLQQSPPIDGHCPDWWAHAPTLLRYLGDLLAADLAQARPGRTARAAPWPLALDFVRDLGADSLELLGMATRLAEALHLGGEGSSLDERLLARPCLADWLGAARRPCRKRSPDQLSHF